MVRRIVVLVAVLLLLAACTGAQPEQPLSKERRMTLSAASGTYYKASELLSGKQLRDIAELEFKQILRDIATAADGTVYAAELVIGIGGGTSTRISRVAPDGTVGASVTVPQLLSLADGNAKYTLYGFDDNTVCGIDFEGAEQVPHAASIHLMISSTGRTEPAASTAMNSFVCWK